MMSLLLAVTTFLFALAKAQNINLNNLRYINYTTVTGYFLQDDPSTNASTFDYTATNFGLINRTYPAVSSGGLTQWEAFTLQVEALKAQAPLNTVYKVLFMGRHGEGYHNAAESYFGTPAWNCYYAELNGNATVTWFDADLTGKGIAQAQIANRFWRHEIAVQHVPYPQSYYTSPMTRCLRTANITFSDLDLPFYSPFIPTVKELLRESIDAHTCDRRHNKTWIHENFPTYDFEPGFSEQDLLWNGVTGESDEAQTQRSLKALDQIFSTDDHTWISITSHSGEIAAILRAIGHQPFGLSTGAVIPVLVKAVFMTSAPSSTVATYTTSTFCSSPPITSIRSLSEGCVCTNGVNITTPLISGVTIPPYATPTLPGPSFGYANTTGSTCPVTSSSAEAYPTEHPYPSWRGWPSQGGW